MGITPNSPRTLAGAYALDAVGRVDPKPYLLARDPSSFSELVNAELHARSDDSVGAQLIACCVKSGGKPAPRGGTTPLHPPAREGSAPP